MADKSTKEIKMEPKKLSKYKRRERKKKGANSRGRNWKQQCDQFKTSHIKSR